MGTTPRLGTATAAEPATSKRGMTPPFKQQLDQLERMECLPNPVREYASPLLTTSTMTNYETSKTPMETVRMMFIIILTKCSLWYTNVEQELVLQTRYGLLHYDYLTCRTGLFIFLSTYLI